MACRVEPCQEEQQVRLEDYLYMVEAVATNFNFEKVKNIRDSEMFGYLAQELVACSLRFNPSKGTFARYLSSHLFNKAIDVLRKFKRTKKRCNYVNIEDLSSIPEKDKDKDEDEEQPSTEFLTKLLAESPGDSFKDLQDRSILLEHYLGKKSVVELSKKYKTTRVTIYNRIKKSISKIRENHKPLFSEI